MAPVTSRAYMLRFGERVLYHTAGANHLRMYMYISSLRHDGAILPIELLLLDELHNAVVLVAIRLEACEVHAAFRMCIGERGMQR